jgi:hypothetical protein
MHIDAVLKNGKRIRRTMARRLGIMRATCPNCKTPVELHRRRKNNGPSDHWEHVHRAEPPLPCQYTRRTHLFA